jgi:hypothetical protein
MTYRRLVVTGVGLACAASLAAQQQPPPQQRPPVFRAGANFVYVDVYPRQDGRIVEGLTLDDFEILEDGKPQKAETLLFVRVEPTPEAERRDPNNTREMMQMVADPTNRAFVVYLDYLHVSTEGAYNIRLPLVRALDSIVGPNDLFAVTTPNDQPRHIVFGRRTTTLEGDLAKYWPWGLRNSIASDRNDPEEERLRQCFSRPSASGDEWRTRDQDGAEAPLYELLIERRREDRTLTSLENFVRYLGGMREARTTLVIVTDGWRLFRADRGLSEEAGKQRVQSPGIVTRGGQMSPLTTASGIADPASCNSELLRLAEIDNERRVGYAWYGNWPQRLLTVDYPAWQARSAAP